MTSLLINYNKIINKTKHPFLLNKIKSIPNTKYDLGLILIIPAKKLDVLDSLEKGDDKILYLNNKSFVDSIQDYNFVIFRDKICEIIYSRARFIPLYIESIENGFPNLDKILISIPVTNTTTINKYSAIGFGNPYICTKNLWKKKEYKTTTICLMKEKNKKYDSNSEIKYVLSQVNNSKFCILNAKLSDKTIKELKLLCERKENNGSKQKEIAGNMVAVKKSEDNVHIIDINYSSMIKGKETGVDIVPGLYNFHSHPRDAYELYNVKLGWPSAQDYIGYLLAIIEDDTIFHIVSSLEGVYIISLNKEWVTKKHKLNNKIGKFIVKNYNLCYQKGNTIDWYLNKVNNITYEGSILFLVQYLSWTKANNIFTLPYAKKYNNCFTCNEKLKFYNKLYNKS